MQCLTFLNRESSSDPYWLDFTNKIGISSSSNVGYLNGVIPTFAKYKDGKIEDIRIIFNDVLKENLNEMGEVESVTVTSSYYEDNPFLNKTFSRTDEETARTVYKKSTLEYYKNKFLEIVGD